jgi:acetyltransferase
MAGELADNGLDVFKEASVPVFSFPEATARALGKMVRYLDIRDRFKHSPQTTSKGISKSPPAIGRKRQASLEEIFPILENYHLTICDYALVLKAEQATDFQKSVGKIALKIANEEIIHKSDEGLVRLNLSSPKEIERAFKEIKNKAETLLSKSVTPLLLAQKMAEDGIELILGAKRDPLFGPVIMFGIGGVFIELYKDVVFRVAPLDESTIMEMIDALKGKKILDGFRNFPPVNKKVLINTIFNFSKLVNDHPEIVEIDLNPLIWSSDDDQPIIVDSRCTIVS